MDPSALFWMLLNFLTLTIMCFYSMMEMACVSINKVRFHYYLSQGNKRAKWLNYLLENPSYLFGTTLIGVNVTMMIGSECARRFYESIGLNPEWAPLTQVLIVLTFGELAPMFAARRYAEHVTQLGIPLLYASAIVMKPILFGINFITFGIDWIFGKSKGLHTNIYLTRDELQKIIEEQEEKAPSGDLEEFNEMISNIFALRSRDIQQVMFPLVQNHMIESTSVTAEVKKKMGEAQMPYLPVYHKEPSNIVGMIFSRDLLRAKDNQQIREFIRPAWFITEQARLIEILTQFRENNQTLAVVLNSKGKAIGILTLDAMLEEIFGKTNRKVTAAPTLLPKSGKLIKRTLSGDMPLSEFSTEFNVDVDIDLDTLSQFVISKLGHHPEVGDSIYVGSYKLTVKEMSLLTVKSVIISSV